MGLEAVMICVDNSEWSRNGDYGNSRFDAQTETANLLAGTKTDQNPETGVGLLTLAGERAEVHMTPMNDLGSFIASLANMQIKGKSDIPRGINTAQLALKHRQNKNQKQRIICFVGSPLSDTVTERQMEQLGKQLKKNNVSLDIVSFGEIENNKARLEKLINAVNSNDTSHLVEVESGKVLSDVVVSSSICFGEGGAPPPGTDGGAGFEFGVDPSTDPELALALKISMEEEKRRQEGANAENNTTGTGGASGSGSAAAAATEPAATETAAAGGGNPAVDIEGFEDMDEELRQALLLSMQDAQPKVEEPDAKKQKTEPKSQTAVAPEPSAEAKMFEDPSFVADLLGSLPGVDLNDAQIQATIQGASGGSKETNNDDKDKSDKDKKGSEGDKKPEDKK